jgi:hypothetical protein
MQYLGGFHLPEREEIPTALHTATILQQLIWRLALVPEQHSSLMDSSLMGSFGHTKLLNQSAGVDLRFDSQQPFFTHTTDLFSQKQFGLAKVAHIKILTDGGVHPLDQCLGSCCHKGTIHVEQHNHTPL